MAIEDIILLLITNLFRTCIIRRFIGIFFEIKKIGKLKTFISYSSFYILTSWIYIIFHLPILNIIVNIIGMCCLTFLYKGKIKKKVIVSLLIYIINMLCDIIASYLFIDYIYGEATEQTFSIVTDLFILLCVIIIERIILQQGKSDLISPQISKLIIIPLISIVMEFLLFYNNLENRLLVEIESMGILLINMIIFYLYYHLQDAYQAKIYEGNLEKQIEIYENQLEIISKTEKKVYSLKHDLKHHITGLNALASKKDIEGIEQYLKKMGKYFEDTGIVIFSGNRNIDSLLNYKLEEAKYLLNDININIKVPEDITIHIFELNVILGNILENAIQAAKDSEKKYLELNIRADSGLLFINLKNSYEGTIKVAGNHFISSKKTRDGHGIGLDNVREVVEKNNGLIDIKYDNYIFIVDIMLYLSQMR